MKAMGNGTIHMRVKKMNTEIERLDAKIEKIASNFSIRGTKIMITQTAKSIQSLINEYGKVVENAKMSGSIFPELQGVGISIERIIGDLKREKKILEQ